MNAYFSLGVAVVGLLLLSGGATAGDIERYKQYYLNDFTGVPANGSVKATFLGTSTLLFDDGETQILIDGFFSRPSVLKLVGPIETDKKVVDAVLKRLKADRVKAIFVAHSHYDHAFDVAYVARKTGAKLYGSASTLNIGRGGGLKDEQMALYEPSKALKVGAFEVTVLKGKHSPPIKGINDDLGQTIDKPLKQPARARDYKEGGAFDFVLTHRKGTILVMPSCNYVEGALDKVRADVLFLGTAGLGTHSDDFRKKFYAETVGKVRPALVIPIHWDNFFLPLSDSLAAPIKPIDNLPVGFDFLIKRLATDKIRFGILQGYYSTELFAAKKQ